MQSNNNPGYNNIFNVKDNTSDNDILKNRNNVNYLGNNNLMHTD